MASSHEYVLGIDVGGGGGRCLLLDLETGEAHWASRAWHARPGPGATADLDLEALWARLGQMLAETLTSAGAHPDQVVGIGVAAMRFGTVALGAGDDVRMAAANRDARGSLAALELAAREGEELEARAGHWPMAVGTLPRLLSLEPRERTELACVFSLGDWIAWRLSGERATDPTQAAGTLLYDLATGGWDEARCERWELPLHALPPIRACGSSLGTVSARAAASLGLAPGSPVAVGGGDTQLALLGLGVVAPGGAGAVCGTTLPVQVVRETGAPVPHLWVEPHALTGTFVVESNAGAVGEALDWLARLLRPGMARGAAWLLAEAARSAPGAGGMLSTFGVQRMDSRAGGFPVGELCLSHLVESNPDGGSAHLARAVVEGAAFSVRANLEQARAEDRRPLALGGGMSGSDLWCRLVADVLGEPVRVGSIPQASALGAALCGATGAGRYPDLAAAAAALVHGRMVEPDPESSRQLGESYLRWGELLEARGPVAKVSAGAALQHYLRADTARALRGPAPEGLRILVTADMDGEALDALRELGEVEYASYREAGRLLAGPTLVQALEGFDVFVTEIDLVDAASLLELPRLRVVASCRGDAVNVDVAACSALGIPVLHAPGRNADAVADLTLAFLLALARKLLEANAFLREPGMEAGDMATMGRAYAGLQGQELWHRTVGLIGFGAVGRKVAARLLPFEARVWVHDPWQPPEVIVRAGARPVGLAELLEASDFVSLHAAVTESSEGLIGAAELARMKPGAALVNTARAALLDEEALAGALQRGHLAGAALDVFSVEPPGADHPLLALPGVIATPHIGGNTLQIGSHQGRIVSEDLGRLLRGEPPRCALNPEAAVSLDWSARRVRPDEATCAALRERPPPTVTDLQKRKPGSAKRVATTTSPRP